ncbi:MAG: ribonuclease H-like domain-containing protein [Bacteroidales bacterium]|nr:MAG: ribonuclease H-like domain-containing protein [Bacteroidales bacterium]
MLSNINIFDILFLDIETVPAEPDFTKLPEHVKEFWEKRSSKFRKENESAADVYGKAGLYAEFGKVVCISAGIINEANRKYLFRVKSFYGKKEKQILSEFSEMLSNFIAKKEVHLCAHNGKEFDFPYLSRRMLINEIELPGILDTAGKKPWETRFLDTMDLWKFGDFRYYISLDHLADVFGIETPKYEMNGSQVSEVYWKEDDLQKIARYCEQDVYCVAQIMLKFKGLDLIHPENIQSLTGS